jgi:hypothetical protein
MQQRFFGVFLGEALVSAVLLPHVVRFWCLIRAFFLLSSRANIVGFLQGRRGRCSFFSLLAFRRQRGHGDQVYDCGVLPSTFWAFMFVWILCYFSFIAYVGEFLEYHCVLSFLSQ